MQLKKLKPCTGKKLPALKTLMSALLVLAVLYSCSGSKAGMTSANEHQKIKTKKMKTVLIIGMNPRTIDYSSPELPKGLTAEQVEQGMRATLDNLDSMGFRAELFLIDTGADPSSGLVHHLAERRYDGIVIGNGIRSIQSNFLLFEKLVNRSVQVWESGLELVTGLGTAAGKR